jgi:hypothetical protein
LFYYNESPRLLPTYFSIEWKEKKWLFGIVF